MHFKIVRYLLSDSNLLTHIKKIDEEFLRNVLIDIGVWHLFE